MEGKSVLYIETAGSIHSARWENFHDSHPKEVEEGYVCLQGRSGHFWVLPSSGAPFRLHFVGCRQRQAYRHFSCES